MMRNILAALHKVMTGRDVPAQAENDSACVSCPGIGELEGVNVVFGVDRITRGLHHAYFPIVAIDDDRQSRKPKSKTSQYGVCLTVAVEVTPRLGGLFGYDTDSGRVRGILDILESVLSVILHNQYLPDGKGGYLTTGIITDIDVERDADVSTDSVKTQLATISYAYGNNE